MLHCQPVYGTVDIKILFNEEWYNSNMWRPLASSEKNLD